jgi:hypothetical protein
MEDQTRDLAVRDLTGRVVRRRFVFRPLPNGYIRVDSRASGLSGLWERDGRPRSGDLTGTIFGAAISRAIQEMTSGKGI